MDGTIQGSLLSEVRTFNHPADTADLCNVQSGIRRRGMTVEALRQFMLSQGPSQAIVSLEWDSIWAINKKVIDPIAPRHWAVLEDDMLVAGFPWLPLLLFFKKLILNF